jgi:hypothetical protein
MIAGGLVWVTNYSTGTLYGLDLTSGATRSQMPIPENGSQVNHFASPSAGGGRLFVGSGDQVTAYTIARPPPLSSTTTRLASSANPVSAGSAVSLTAAIAPAPDGGTVTFTDGGAPISSCYGVAVTAAPVGEAECHTAFAQPGPHILAASYSGDAFYAASTSAVLAESVKSGVSVTSGVPRLSGLHVSSHRVSIAGRKVGGRCVAPTKQNERHKYCRRPVKLKLTYTLNQAATITLTLRQRAPGRKVKGRCAKRTKKNHKQARCTRLVAVPGSITLAGKSGPNEFAFAGRIGGRRLGPGSYQLTASPAANGHTGTPQAVTFRIVG